MTTTSGTQPRAHSSVADYAHREVKTIEEEATIQEAGKRMARFNIGSLLVTNNGTYVGMLTDTDLARVAAARGLNPTTEPVRSIMSREITAIEGHRSMEEAQTFMKSRGIRHLAVLAQGTIVGIVTLSDVLHYYQSIAPLRR
ncbi:MAG: CBS domain-containing protein [Nitrospirae bacterium]|nr:MAG: CBS domain-containing protein [Nitrospirota bacterium]